MKGLAAVFLVAAAVAATKPADATPPTQPSGSASGGGGSPDIPGDYLELYKAAPRCSGLSWQVLAAVGKVETNHGRSNLPGVHSGQNYAGAMGPMQFLAGTFRSVRQRHPEVGRDVYDPRHAIPAAAWLLCDNGAARGDIRAAIFSYNHANWYVNQVIKQSKEY